MDPKAADMRPLVCLLFCLLILTPTVAETFVLEHQDRPAVEFSLDGFELVGSRTRSQTIHSLVCPDWNGSRVSVQVRLKSWLGEDKAIREYNALRGFRRSDPHSRLVDSPDIPGAVKAAQYRMTDPYQAEVLVLFRNELRCEFMVTGAEALPADRREVLDQIKRSVRLFGPTAPLRIEGADEAPPPIDLRLDRPQERNQEGG